MQLRRCPGVVVEPMGEHFWAAFSGTSGQTHLINDATALLLQDLPADGWIGVDELAQRMQGDDAAATDEVRDLITGALMMLEDTGLVRVRRTGPSPTA